MLFNKIKKTIGNKRTSSNLLWKNIFFVRDFIEQSESKSLDMLFMFGRSKKLKIREISPSTLTDVIGKYYYFGEFGYFHFNILGGLSQYFKIYPEHKIEIVTYEDYGKILELLFPDNVKAYFVNYKFNEIYRSCHYYHDRKFRVAIKKMGFKRNIAFHLMPITKRLPKIKRDSSRIIFIHATNPLIYPLNVRGEKFISIFPRFRRVGSDRNLSKAEWNKIIKLLSKFDYKIVVHTYASEFIKLGNKDFIYPKNIYEQIAYLNNSVLCITPDSGFINFAQNCKCGVFVITQNAKRFEKYKEFNPFSTKIYVAEESENYLLKLKKVLKGGDLDGKHRKRN